MTQASQLADQVIEIGGIMHDAGMAPIAAVQIPQADGYGTGNQLRDGNADVPGPANDIIQEAAASAEAARAALVKLIELRLGARDTGNKFVGMNLSKQDLTIAAIELGSGDYKGAEAVLSAMVASVKDYDVGPYDTGSLIASTTPGMDQQREQDTGIAPA